MKNFRTAIKSKYNLPTTVEKTFSGIPTLSGITIFESGWENNTPGKSFGPYVREYYLLHFVLEGKGTYEIHGKKHTIKKNQVFLIPPDVKTTYTADGKDPWKYFWIGFNANQCDNLLEACGFDGTKYVVPFSDMLLINRAIKKLYTVKTNLVAYDYFIHGCLYELLGCMLHNAKKEYSSMDDNAHVVTAKNFIEGHFTEPITISDVAKHVGLDRSYFSRIFKESTKVSPQEYLMDTRLKQALILVSQTSLPLSQIALKCAFNDYSHFYKAFSKKYGQTPGSFRRAMQNQPPTNG